MKASDTVSRKYAAPPVIEALCEVQFTSDPPWLLTVPGQVYERVKEIFPTQRQTTNLTFQLSTKPMEASQFSAHSLMQFFSVDEKSVVQVGPQVITINVLKPYPTWQSFFPLIQQGISAYREVVPGCQIQRISLRYLNRIEIPAQRINLEDFFEFYPYIGQRLPQEFGNFTTGVQFEYENARDILSMQLAKFPNDQTFPVNTVVCLLDLNYFLVRPAEITWDRVFHWIEQAHAHIETVFEAAISPKLRHIFQEENA